MHIITFRPLGSHTLADLSQDGPSCFNGMVRIRKYKLSYEVIDEPVEVLQERLQRLWDYSTNYHDSTPLQQEAKKLGYKLVGMRGSKVERVL